LLNTQKEIDTSASNNQEESSTQTPYSEIDMQYDRVEELKKDIIKLMKEKNPISLLRKDMIRRRAKKLLKMELRKIKHERIASKISA
jgi:hypothetical protein